MNEQTNTQLVQRAYASVAAGYMQALLQLLDTGIEWQSSKMDGVPFAGTWHGHQQVLGFMGLLAETQEVVEFQLDQFIAQDDTVIALSHFFMRVRARGKDSKSDWAHCWTIKSGKITRFREFVNTAVGEQGAQRLALDSHPALVATA